MTQSSVQHEDFLKHIPSVPFEGYQLLEMASAHDCTSADLHKNASATGLCTVCTI